MDNIEQEKENALKAIQTLPKYESFDGILDVAGAQELFCDKKESEAMFVDSIFDDIAPMLSSVYQDDIKELYREHWFRHRKQGYFDFRADLYAVGEKRNYLIEAKNPTHTFRESLAGITQLMMYNVVLSKYEKDIQLIYLSSVIEPVVIDFIKQYNVDIEVFFMNGKQTAHWSEI